LRLFVALDLPPAVREALPAPGEGWRAVPRESLHVTLAFLGARDAAEPVVEAVREAMRPITALALDSAVLLPPRRPRVMAVRLAGDMADLQSAVASALDAVEKRAFLPHVTIGRARERPSLALPAVPRIAFTAPSVSVYRSHLSPKGAGYEPLATFPVLTIASDPEALREVRLAALLDSPGSFLMTHADEAARDVAEWAALAARSAEGVTDRVFLAPAGQGMAAGHLDGDTVELWGMWVAPAARGHGLGRALLDAVVRWAASIGARRVVLAVRDGVPYAPALYESAGFTASGRVGDQTNHALALPRG
jgi:2'-5' RNA ligase